MIDLTPVAVVALSVCVLLLAAAVVALARRPGNSYSETYHTYLLPETNDRLVNRRGVSHTADDEDESDWPTF